MVKLARKIGFIELTRLKNYGLVKGNMYDSLTFKLDIDRFKDFYNSLLYSD